MATCPNGHTSESADYCDVCGDLMDGAVPADLDAAAPALAPAGGEEPVRCPICGTPRAGRFCEEDGHDFATAGGQATHPHRRGGRREAAGPDPMETTPPEPAPLPGWSVLISADAAYHARVLAQEGPDSGGLRFPRHFPRRRVPLLGDKVRIGRRSVARGLLPEIDLSVPPEDPGVSHTHALLVATPEGGWTLVDPGSTNGTTLNGADDPVPPGTPVPVGDGDRIHVGAWTTLTLQHRGGSRP
ncbi:FHA domain-containing protein [Actinomadura sp. PM05-2]|uniref:FHA domain-containing protein n=1 Tax=Actinomadura parmotrematis TaxID=2864039 RepID=A0ABS7FNH9_9ACTN|nr:FHA domain-containing protein [Actinomadura parmotrematis]